MKMKYFFASLILSTAVMTSCGEAKDESTETDSKEVAKEEIADENEVVETEEAKDDMGIQSQWDDIVSLIKSGEKSGLNMYLSKSSPQFSNEAWDYVDLSEPEYAAAIAEYSSFSDLPEATNMTDGSKVLNVYFETEIEGEVMESAIILNFILKDGLLWINGCQLAG